MSKKTESVGRALTLPGELMDMFILGLREDLRKQLRDCMNGHTVLEIIQEVHGLERELRAALHEHNGTVPKRQLIQPAEPRYDEIYQDGIDWLNELS